MLKCCLESRYATNLVAAVKVLIILFTMSSGTILPGRFDNGDSKVGCVSLTHVVPQMGGK